MSDARDVPIPAGALAELCASVRLRRRPEDVADLVLTVLGARLSRAERNLLTVAAGGSLRRAWHGYTSMLEAFAPVIGAQRQATTVAVLFDAIDRLEGPAANDPDAVEQVIRTACEQIGKTFGGNDFLTDRLNREQRAAAGLGELSKRQYNKRFRLLQRLEAKLTTMVRATLERDAVMLGKSGLASRLDPVRLAADPDTACFVAYLTARSNLRSEFTVTSQQQPFDQIADLLLRRLRARAETDWWAVAHLHPVPEVLAQLTDEQRGRLLGDWYAELRKAAALLERAYRRCRMDRERMVVQRGDDSSAWNAAASAWNTARAHWISVLEAMNATRILDAVCPGKVLKLMAADVVAWHLATGGALHPDTPVWAELPLPWRVLDGREHGDRAMVEAACARHGRDPAGTGWTTGRRPRTAAAFRPTPELVHGVTVADPLLAQLLRSAGVFSGKALRPAASELFPSESG
ncbi:hypothetical protein [Streptacidiphilus sp. PAMC 29251]